MLEGESSWRFLQELKANPATATVPVLVVTVTNREDKARELGADEFVLEPIEKSWLLRKLRALANYGAYPGYAPAESPRRAVTCARCATRACSWVR